MLLGAQLLAGSQRAFGHLVDAQDVTCVTSSGAGDANYLAARDMPTDGSISGTKEPTFAGRAGYRSAALLLLLAALAYSYLLRSFRWAVWGVRLPLRADLSRHSHLCLLSSCRCPVSSH